MIPELADAIKNSVFECLEDAVSVSFSGGVDSSLISWIAKEQSDVYLITSGTEKSKDIIASRFSSKLLGLGSHYYELILTEKDVVSAYKQIHNITKLDFLKIDILVPLYLAMKKAKSLDQSVILYGSGAEELFVGYDRYYKYYESGKDLDNILREEFRTLKNREIKWIKRLCYKLGLEARFPYYNNNIAKLVFSIPLEERMADRKRKKGIIREVAQFLGLPSQIIDRKKIAAQYGSGVHKLLAKYAKKHGLPGSKFE